MTRHPVDRGRSDPFANPLRSGGRQVGRQGLPAEGGNRQAFSTYKRKRVPGQAWSDEGVAPNTVRPNNCTRASGVADREKGAGRGRLDTASLANAAEKTKGSGQSCSARKSYSGLPSWQFRQRNASQGAPRLALERPAQREASRVTDRS